MASTAPLALIGWHQRWLVFKVGETFPKHRVALLHPEQDSTAHGMHVFQTLGQQKLAGLLTFVSVEADGDQLTVFGQLLPALRQLAQWQVDDFGRVESQGSQISWFTHVDKHGTFMRLLAGVGGTDF
ncbi:MAG TPA: hypothetical protein VLQ47_02135 [Rhodoferax sp.]|nr:hypothetical protein [Rhodoferax sp.]